MLRHMKVCCCILTLLEFIVCPLDAFSDGANSHVGIDAPFGRLEFSLPTISSREFQIVDYGARPSEKCTDAIAKAMTACHAAGGGRVVVPRGTWLTGKVHFKSNCELHLAEGAVLEFSDDPKDYLPVVHTSWEGVECLNYSPLIYAYGVENVAVTGPGEISARMATWRSWFGRSPAHMQATESLYHWCSTNAPMHVRDLTAIANSHVRPHLIQMNRAKNVRLEGFYIRNSPFWTIHLYHSENCVVRGLRSFCHGNNNDGVDVEMTRNVLIEDCDLDQGDDGIVLKAGRNQDAWRLARPTENVVVRRCNLHMSHSLLGIGSELSGGVRNVWMTDCRLESTHALLKIKTNRRRGGFVENVWVDNVICSGNVKDSVFSLHTDTIYQWARFPDYELKYTAIRNINIRNATAGMCDWIVNLKGDAHLPPRDFTVDGLSVRFARRGERQISNCENVSIRNLQITHPGEVALEKLRRSIIVKLEDATLGPAFFTQRSNALPEVKRLQKVEQFPSEEDGDYHVNLFPGEYDVRWPRKDGREGIGSLSVKPSGESFFRRINVSGNFIHRGSAP